MVWVREWWPVIMAIFFAVASGAVALYRVSEVEAALKEIREEPVKVRELQGDVRRIKCEIGNVKNLIKSQSEVLCI